MFPVDTEDTCLDPSGIDQLDMYMKLVDTHTLRNLQPTFALDHMDSTSLLLRSSLRVRNRDCMYLLDNFDM